MESYLKERTLYGSKRLGIVQDSVAIVSNIARTLQTPAQGWKVRLLGDKSFELSDHLGNVTMTVSDWKQLVDGSEEYEAQVLSYEQYYPFGSTQGGRGANSVDYRFGFNGKENDGEWGTSLVQDYGFRLYNPGIGKFLSVDPLAPSYPWYTPYQFAGNMPIAAIDLDGLEPYAKQLQTDYGMNQSFIIAHTTFVHDGSRNGALGHFGTDEHRQAVVDHMWFVTHSTMNLWASDKQQYDQFYSAYNTYAIITEMDRQVEGFAEALYEKWAAARAESEEAGANVIRGMITAFENRQAKWESLELAMEALDLAGVATAVKLMQQARRNRNRARMNTRKVKPSDCGCFTAGTVVKTKDGDKKIEEVEVGDWVWSYDDSTETVALKQVIQLHRYTRDTIYQLHVAGELIETTGDHPFYTEKSYIEAKYLTVGDTLQLQNSGYSIVDSISIKLGIYTVYNFTVKDYHTYFVSSNGILVHNEPCPYLKPENGYLRGKKHGIKQQPADAIRMAKESGKPVGKWGNKKDLEYAGTMAKKLEADGGFMDFPINTNTKSIVYNPDGSTSVPDMIRVRNNGDGTFHGFPINSSSAEPITRPGTLIK